MIKRTVFFVLILLPAFLILSCGGKKGDAAASMEQLHAENGRPVSVRKIQTEDFSVYLKYPALIQASSESTAYAGLNDVVRTISAKVGETAGQNDVIVSFSADNQILQQATLAHGNAQSAYNRISALFRSNDVSRQDYDNVRMQYELAQTNLKAANDMVYVKAPISGTITRINVRVTENVRPGEALFTVSNSNAFEARLYVGGDEIDRIQVGARAFINLSGGRQEGRITQVSLIMDSQRQSFPVTVVFDGGNPQPRPDEARIDDPQVTFLNRRLVSGMNVDIEVETYRNEKAIVLVRRELVHTEAGPAVFVVDNNEGTGQPAAAEKPRARLVAVHAGEEKGMFLEITGGLAEGDIIVSEGVHSINEKTKLNIVPALLSSGQ